MVKVENNIYILKEVRPRQKQLSFWPIEWLSQRMALSNNSWYTVLSMKCSGPYLQLKKYDVLGYSNEHTLSWLDS